MAGFGRFVMFGKGETGRSREVRGFRSDRGSGLGVCQIFSGLGRVWAECHRDTSGRPGPAASLKRLPTSEGLIRRSAFVPGLHRSECSGSYTLE